MGGGKDVYISHRDPTQRPIVLPGTVTGKWVSNGRPPFSGKRVGNTLKMTFPDDGRAGVGLSILRQHYSNDPPPQALMAGPSDMSRWGTPSPKVL